MMTLPSFLNFYFVPSLIVLRSIITLALYVHSIKKLMSLTSMTVFDSLYMLKIICYISKYIESSDEIHTIIPGGSISVRYNWRKSIRLSEFHGLYTTYGR